MLTHAVYDSLTGEVKSEHPDASSAFAAASRIGGERYGYVVGPINCPPKPNKDIVREKRKEPYQEGEECYRYGSFQLNQATT